MANLDQFGPGKGLEGLTDQLSQVRAVVEAREAARDRLKSDLANQVINRYNSVASTPTGSALIDFWKSTSTAQSGELVLLSGKINIGQEDSPDMREIIVSLTPNGVQTREVGEDAPTPGLSSRAQRMLSEHVQNGVQPEAIFGRLNKTLEGGLTAAISSCEHRVEELTAENMILADYLGGEFSELGVDQNNSQTGPGNGSGGGSGAEVTMESSETELGLAQETPADSAEGEQEGAQDASEPNAEDHEPSTGADDASEGPSGESAEDADDEQSRSA